MRLSLVCGLQSDFTGVTLCCCSVAFFWSSNSLSNLWQSSDSAGNTFNNLRDDTYLIRLTLARQLVIDFCTCLKDLQGRRHAAGLEPH